MHLNPITNALLAVAYISAVVVCMRFIESIRHDTPDTLVDGIGVISLFVCSAAVMAFLFFYRPMLLLLEQKRAEAGAYFLKTLGVFGLITILILTVVSMQ